MEKESFLSRHKTQIAVVAAAIGSYVLIPKGWEAFQNWRNPESDIVAGVPGQVEDHDTSEYCAGMVKGICINWETEYYLTIEQCPADVQAAKEGQETTSFNPDLGAIYEGCNYDNVQVNSATFYETPAGATITFDGEVGEPLHR
jgi:hypothetical protein